MTSSQLQSYSRPGRPPDFQVRYRFFTADEGGRISAPQQHIRWDFLYHDDDPQHDGIYAIWPEFLDSAGNPLPEGPVPYNGLADMFILNPDMRAQVHRHRIAVGVRGYFVEGPKRVAECEVTKLIGLAESPP
jgi:hypothetical protein